MSKMNELRTKYKFLIIALSLLVISPIFIVALYKEYIGLYLESTLIAQTLIDHYKIEINECLSCQENGWKLGIIGIGFVITAAISAFSAAFIALAVNLRLFANWPLRFTMDVLLLGKYPEIWKS